MTCRPISGVVAGRVAPYNRRSGTGPAEKGTSVAAGATGDITLMVREVQSGRRAAADELLPLVYAQLRAVAWQARLPAGEPTPGDQGNEPELPE